MSCYYELVNHLKNKIKGKIAYKPRVRDLLNLPEHEHEHEQEKIEELLNSSKIEINDDDKKDIVFTIYLIRDEIKRLEDFTKRMETRLDNLEWLNEMLILFKEQPQTSRKKARKFLKTVYVYIFDFDCLPEELSGKRTTYEQLIERVYKDGPYPLRMAKKTRYFQPFLQHIY